MFKLIGRNIRSMTLRYKHSDVKKNREFKEIEFKVPWGKISGKKIILKINYYYYYYLNYFNKKKVNYGAQKMYNQFWQFTVGKIMLDHLIHLLNVYQKIYHSWQLTYQDMVTPVGYPKECHTHQLFIYKQLNVLKNITAWIKLD